MPRGAIWLPRLTVPNPRSWFERHAHRHDWALSAFDRFVHELAPELSAQLTRSEQVTVVVYGATQVGKTTLILDLLGLESQAQKEVADVLRGGQARGNSATVMPLRYGRSSDDLWRIGNSEALDRTQATRELAERRRAVERGDPQSILLTDILIPATLFPPARKDALEVDVKLIDLPGLDARNAHERELVAALARRYVTVADLVLLVTQASNLPFLKPERLELEELANWAHQSVRFRVVITAGFSLSSVRRRLLASPLDEAQVRALMIGEIETLELRIPPSFTDNVYVLELGESASDLAACDPDYYARVSPLVTAFRRALIRDIKHASGPFSRVFAAFQLDQVVTGQIAAFESDYVERKTALQAQHQDFEAQIRTLYSLPIASDVWAALQAHKADLDSQALVNAEWTRVLHVLLEADCQAIMTSLFAPSPIPLVDKNVAALLEALHDQRTALKAQFQGWPDALRALLFDGMHEHLRTHIDGFFQALSAEGFDECDFHGLEYQLDQYSTNRYWRSSSYESDLAQLAHVVSQSRRRHIDLAYTQCVASLRSQQQMQAHALPAARVSLRQVQNKIGEYTANLERLASLKKQLDQNIERMNDSRVIAQHFERRIQESFSSALQASMAEVSQGSTPTDQFLGLMNAHLIISEAEKLYSGKATP